MNWNESKKVLFLKLAMRFLLAAGFIFVCVIAGANIAEERFYKTLPTDPTDPKCCSGPGTGFGGMIAGMEGAFVGFILGVAVLVIGYLLSKGIKKGGIKITPKLVVSTILAIILLTAAVFITRSQLKTHPALTESFYTAKENKQGLQFNSDAERIAYFQKNEEAFNYAVQLGKESKLFYLNSNLSGIEKAQFSDKQTAKFFEKYKTEPKLSPRDVLSNLQTGFSVFHNQKIKPFLYGVSNYQTDTGYVQFNEYNQLKCDETVNSIDISDTDAEEAAKQFKNKFGKDTGAVCAPIKADWYMFFKVTKQVNIGN